VTPPHEIDMVADSKEASDMKADDVAHYSRLVREARALFGSHHYRRYRFLLTLSEGVAHFNLEHHESSDNRVRERTLIDADARVSAAGLLPHEFVHS
jgi:predicted metalloprotease with PDZ domain